MKILLLVVAALGALAFWRKDTLKDDVGKAGDAVKTAGEKIRSRGGNAAEDAIGAVENVADEAADAASDAAEDAAEAVADEAATA